MMEGNDTSTLMSCSKLLSSVVSHPIGRCGRAVLESVGGGDGEIGPDTE